MLSAPAANKLLEPTMKKRAFRPFCPFPLIPLAPALCVASTLWLLPASPTQAQTGTPAAAAASTPPREAAQFDFLIGHWDLEVVPKTAGLAAMLHGAPRLSGVWKAWRAFGVFGVEDELRIVDAAGNPLSLNHGLRSYDSKARRWTQVNLDVYRARVSQSTATWQDGEMRSVGNSAVDGKPSLLRTRFFDIGSDRFRLRQDRSNDDGASWEEAVLTINARRLAAKAPR
jgi:hypothetical protein